MICIGLVHHGVRRGLLRPEAGEDEVTYAERVGLTSASVVLVVGLLIFAAWKVVDWRADRRRARRVAAARAAIAERARINAAWNVIVANYDVADEYEPPIAGYLGFRAEQIELPREGRPE